MNMQESSYARVHSHRQLAFSQNREIVANINVFKISENILALSGAFESTRNNFFILCWAKYHELFVTMWWLMSFALGSANKLRHFYDGDDEEITLMSWECNCERERESGKWYHYKMEEEASTEIWWLNLKRLQRMKFRNTLISTAESRTARE